MDCMEVLHPDWQLLLELDWSSGHARMCSGALNVNDMNVSYGKGQLLPHDSIIPANPNEASLYLGPHAPTLKAGDTQRFYFTADDPPPFHDPAAPKYDTPTTKRNRKGEVVVKEGYVDKPKGL